MLVVSWLTDIPRALQVFLHASSIDRVAGSPSHLIRTSRCPVATTNLVSSVTKNWKCLPPFAGLGIAPISPVSLSWHARNTALSTFSALLEAYPKSKEIREVDVLESSTAACLSCLARNWTHSSHQLSYGSCVKLWLFIWSGVGHGGFAWTFTSRLPSASKVLEAAWVANKVWCWTNFCNLTMLSFLEPRLDSPRLSHAVLTTRSGHDMSILTPSTTTEPSVGAKTTLSSGGISSPSALGASCTSTATSTSSSSALTTSPACLSRCIPKVILGEVGHATSSISKPKNVEGTA